MFMPVSTSFEELRPLCRTHTTINSDMHPPRGYPSTTRPEKLFGDHLLRFGEVELPPSSLILREHY